MAGSPPRTASFNPTRAQIGEELGGRDPLPAVEFILGLLDGGVETRSVFNVELATTVDHGNLNLGTVRQVNGLVDDEAPVFDVSTQGQQHDWAMIAPAAHPEPVGSRGTLLEFKR